MRLLLAALVLLGCSSESSQRTLVVTQDGGSGGTTGASGAGGNAGKGGSSIHDGGPVEIRGFGEECDDNIYPCETGLTCGSFPVDGGERRPMCVFNCERPPIDGGMRQLCAELGATCVGGNSVCCPPGAWCF